MIVQEFARQSSFKNKDPKVRVIGVGQAGGNIVSSLYEKDMKANLVALNTDWQQLSRQKADHKILIGLEATGGIGCGGNLGKGRDAVRENLTEIREQLDSEFLILIGGLGNGTATGGLPLIASEAKKRGATVLGFFIVPFFMAQSDYDKTKVALSELQDTVDTAIVLDHNRLPQVFDQLPLTESFVVMNELVATSINSLIDMIRGDELLEVNFTDIKEVLSAGSFGTIAIAEKRRGQPLVSILEEAMGKRLFHFDTNQAESAIIHVIGNESLSLSEVQACAKSAQSMIGENAHIVLGAQTDEAMGDTIRVIAVLSGIEPKDIVVSEKTHEIQKLLTR